MRTQPKMQNTKIRIKYRDVMKLIMESLIFLNNVVLSLSVFAYKKFLYQSLYKEKYNRH